MHHFRIPLALLLFTAMIVGCGSGERITALIEEPTADGRWRIDGTLIRSYNVDLQQAHESIEELAREEDWTILQRSISSRTAELKTRTPAGLLVEFQIWAPQDRATEIGIEYEGGDRLGSIEVFQKLEPLLPGERLNVDRS